MISVTEATAIIQEHQFTIKTESVEIAKSAGRILAQPIKADRDLPPFHRASMDGIAIQYEAFLNGSREFTLDGLTAAGEPIATLKDSAKALEIMTGAVLPQNADTVIRYEDIEIKNGKAILKTDSIERGQNIHYQGQDAKKRETLLNPGIKISPAEVALFASTGKKQIEVFLPPHAAIVSTGNELVEITATPLPHQLRQSNNYALQAALATIGCSSSLYHLPDDKTTLEKKLTKIFNDHELIILSGGVSKGKLDFIPEILESLQIQKHFHQVSQKPGKPFWFGSSSKNSVFALPGNPVSTFLCYYRYIQPWLLATMQVTIKKQSAVLANNFSFKPPLTYFLQVEIINDAGKLLAYPLAGNGSGDFTNLKNVDGFLELPADKTDFRSGESFSFFSFRS